LPRRLEMTRIGVKKYISKEKPFLSRGAQKRNARSPSLSLKRCAAVEETRKEGKKGKGRGICVDIPKRTNPRGVLGEGRGM